MTAPALRLERDTAVTEGTFLRCLHDEKPDDPRVAERGR